MQVSIFGVSKHYRWRLLYWRQFEQFGLYYSSSDVPNTVTSGFRNSDEVCYCLLLSFVSFSIFLLLTYICWLLTSVTNPTYISPTPTATGTGTSIVRGSSYRR